MCTGGNLACTQVRTVNVQLAPGFVVQQPQEVASLERCEEQATVIEAEIAPGAIPRSHTYDRSYVQQDMFYWDDNNRFKPRTTVTTLVTRGAVLYNHRRAALSSHARTERRQANNTRIQPCSCQVSCFVAGHDIFLEE